MHAPVVTPAPIRGELHRLSNEIIDYVEKNSNLFSKEQEEYVNAMQEWAKRGRAITADAKRLMLEGDRAQAESKLTEYNKSRPRRKVGRPKGPGGPKLKDVYKAITATLLERALSELQKSEERTKFVAEAAKQVLTTSF